MSKQRNTNVPAAFLILLKDNKVLMLKRKNTGFGDGMYSLIAGHVEKNESFAQCMLREAKEEGGILIQPQDLKIRHIMHQNTGTKENNQWINAFFVAERWEGEITNLEPEKCEELVWFDINDLPTNTIPNIRHAIKCIQNNVFYSELGWE